MCKNIIWNLALVCLVIVLIFSSLPLSVNAKIQKDFWATAYNCVYESEMDGTQTVTLTITGTSYTLKASFLFGGYGAGMQGTGRTGPNGDYIHYDGGGGGFVSIDDPVEDAEVRARYAELGITDFTGFGNIGLNYPGSATYSRVSGVTGASGRTLVAWKSIAVDPSEISLGTTGTLFFKSGTTPSGDTHMDFSADDTGGVITGKRIDIYVGEGKSAINKWYETGGNRYVNVYTKDTVVTSCDSSGNSKDQFIPDESVYVKASGLWPETTYKIWIQDDPVGEGNTLVAGENPSVITPKSVTTNSDGNFATQLIWSIPEDASVTYHKYDIVIDRQNDGASTGKYNDASDGIDSASVVGFVAPVPELPTVVLFSIGLLALVGYIGLRRQKNS